jgi:alpha-beta hydrolase superfamily lysophospholipase
VIATTTETITLKKTANTQRPGIFGVTSADGQAIVGPIVSSDAETVTRAINHVTGVLSDKVAWNTTVYGGALRDQQLKLPIHDVLIPSVLGAMPAWFVPGTLDTWVIMVHGASGTREQSLRFFPTLSHLGFPILDITYRGDEEAPASPDGLTHLGDTEWQDLEASVKYALAQGAHHVVLYGISLGGTIVETFLQRSSDASNVQAVVLDSPILNWNTALASVAKKNSLPSFIVNLTKKIILMRTGIQFDNLDLTQDQSVIPMLLFHGISDTTAPIEVSDTFASRHEATITYHRIADAEHTQCWNADAQMYEAALHSFLTHILESDVSAHLPR